MEGLSVVVNWSVPSKSVTGLDQCRPPSEDLLTRSSRRSPVASLEILCIHSLLPEMGGRTTRKVKFLLRSPRRRENRKTRDRQRHNRRRTGFSLLQSEPHFEMNLHIQSETEKSPSNSWAYGTALI